MHLRIQEPFSDKNDVTVSFSCASRQKRFAADLVHILWAVAMSIFGDGLTQALRQIRVSARPMKKSLHILTAHLLVPGKTACQRSRLGRREVVKIDSPADIKRGQPRVANQIAWRGHPEQAEGQALKLRFFRATIVAGPD